MQAKSVSYINRSIYPKLAAVGDIATLANRNLLSVQSPAVRPQTTNADSVTIGNKSVLPAKQNSDQENTKSVTHHVIEEYNAMGKRLLTFIDHKNDVIYQVPS